jgi:uncharacterized protein GlcG (DUF336 family)
MNLDTAEAIIAGIFQQAAVRQAPPLTVAVVDPAGSLVSLKRQDGAPPIRPDIAAGKARACVWWGKSSRIYGKLTEDRPPFGRSVSDLAPTALVPAAGGVPVKDANGTLIGAVGVSGDTSDNDEALAVAALQALGLTPVLD